MIIWYWSCSARACPNQVWDMTFPGRGTLSFTSQCLPWSPACRKCSKIGTKGMKEKTTDHFLSGPPPPMWPYVQSWTRHLLSYKTCNIIQHVVVLATYKLYGMGFQASLGWCSLTQFGLSSGRSCWEAGLESTGQWVKVKNLRPRQAVAGRALPSTPFLTQGSSSSLIMGWTWNGPQPSFTQFF